MEAMGAGCEGEGAEASQLGTIPPDRVGLVYQVGGWEGTLGYLPWGEEEGTPAERVQGLEEHQSLPARAGVSPEAGCSQQCVHNIPHVQSRKKSWLQR